MSVPTVSIRQGPAIRESHQRWRETLLDSIERTRNEIIAIEQHASKHGWAGYTFRYEWLCRGLVSDNAQLATMNRLLEGLPPYGEDGMDLG